MAEESVNQSSSGNDSTGPAPWENALATLITVQTNADRRMEALQDQMRDLMMVIRTQAVSNLVPPLSATTVTTASAPTYQVHSNTSPLLPTPSMPPFVTTAEPPPCVPCVPPPPSVSYASPPLPQPTHIFQMENHDMHDDEAIDIVDDAHDSVNEIFAKAIEDDLLLTLEPMTSTSEAQDEPETVFHVHCPDVSQVCSLVNCINSLTNIASPALDDKFMLPTVSRTLPVEAQGQKFFSSTPLATFMVDESHTDLRSNLFQQRGYDPGGSSTSSPKTRPEPRPPWRAKPLTMFGLIGCLPRASGLPLDTEGSTDGPTDVILVAPKQPSKRPRPMPKPPWMIEDLPPMFHPRSTPDRSQRMRKIPFLQLRAPLRQFRAPQRRNTSLAAILAPLRHPWAPRRQTTSRLALCQAPQRRRQRQIRQEAPNLLPKPVPTQPMLSRTRISTKEMVKP